MKNKTKLIKNSIASLLLTTMVPGFLSHSITAFATRKLNSLEGSSEKTVSEQKPKKSVRKSGYADKKPVPQYILRQIEKEINRVPTPEWLFEPTFLPKPDEFVEEQVEKQSVRQPAEQVAENILDNLENNKYYMAILDVLQKKLKTNHIFCDEKIGDNYLLRLLKTRGIDYEEFKLDNKLIERSYMVSDAIDWLFEKIGVSDMKQFEVLFRAYKKSKGHKTIFLGRIEKFTSFLYNEKVAERFISTLKKKRAYVYEEIIEAFKKFAETDGYFTQMELEN